jgi:hypothetical protein
MDEMVKKTRISETMDDRGSIPRRCRDSLQHSVKTDSAAHPASYETSMGGGGGHFPGCNAAGT